MNPFKYSLINKIQFLGLILALLMMFVLFLAYQATMFYNKKEQVHHAIKVYNLLSNDENKLQDYLDEYGIVVLEDKNIIKKIKTGKNLITDLLIQSVMKQTGIELFVYQNHIFFSLKIKKKMSYFISKKSSVSTTIFQLILYGVLLFLLLYGIYYYIKNALSPLVRLNRNIEKFSKAEDIDINYESANDEIANVANAFYSAIECNEKLKSQRDMFIRTIMHEVNTSITKAKFITHFMNAEQEEKGKLDSLINSMQEELDKLHEFESVNTKILVMDMNAYSLNTLIADVCDVLLLDEEVDIDEDEVIKVFDYTLFMVAIKNLIDNAIKYSKDHQVKVVLRPEYIEVKNLTATKRPLEIDGLIKPFKQENESSSGMGLGLYLINEIVNKHNYKLEYSFADNYHIFRVVF